MREIKFRAWDKEKKDMYYSDFRLDWNGKVFWWKSEVGYEDWRHSDVVVLMQYTGLKDKSGKEIYEGDIVENGDYIGAVVWVNGEGRFILQSFTDGSGAMIKGVKTYSPIEGEIIGNIYENPELT